MKFTVVDERGGTEYHGFGTYTPGWALICVVKDEDSVTVWNLENDGPAVASLRLYYARQFGRRDSLRMNVYRDEIMCQNMEARR